MNYGSVLAQKLTTRFCSYFITLMFSAIFHPASGSNLTPTEARWQFSTLVVFRHVASSTLTTFKFTFCKLLTNLFYVRLIIVSLRKRILLVLYGASVMRKICLSIYALS